MLDFGTSNSNSEVSKSNVWKITSEGAVSYNVLYCQQLSIAGYQVSYHAIVIILSNFQQVSTAFKRMVSFGSEIQDTGINYGVTEW